MILGLPVMDSHELTHAAVEHLANTVSVGYKDIIIAIFDNGSEKPYSVHEYDDLDINTVVMGVGKNLGYYLPLQMIAEAFNHDYIGLMHNDVFIYEQGWDKRMIQAFEADPKLGLIGLVGSNEIDERGGRGGGTVCHFRGADTPFGKGQSQAAGRRITGIEPAACLDSLFMMFRREAIPDLVREYDGWDDLPLAHFYDRIWPLRLIEKDWHVATMGVECDHLGGMTTVANPAYRDDCISWLDDRGIPYRIADGNDIAAETNDARNQPSGNPETEMYLVAERRYLSEYRDEKKLIPCLIRSDYAYYKV